MAKKLSIQTVEILDADEQNVLPKDGKPILDNDERKYMYELEELVSKGVKASIIATKALHEIYTYKDGKFWKAYFKTWPEYTRKRWGYARGRTYQLMSSGEVIHEIETVMGGTESKTSDWMPTNENHLRPLLKLEPAQYGACWKAVLAENKPADLTAKLVKHAMVKFAKEQGINLVVKRAKPRLSDKKRALAALAKARTAFESFPNAAEIMALFDKIKAIAR